MSSSQWPVISTAPVGVGALAPGGVQLERMRFWPRLILPVILSPRTIYSFSPAHVK